jgi:hypothetical protein
MVLPSQRTLLASLAALAALLLVLAGVPGVEAAGEHGLSHPEYGSPFWDHWGDGRAELAGYALTYPRYGQAREGTAVTIFVTEPFSEHERVKADRPTDDSYQVLKLNLVRDFTTGIYDYNLMTSTFLALEAVQGYPPGAPTKVSFTGQEWCGHVYQQLRFDRDGVAHGLHSYFQGEGDDRSRLDAHHRGTAEDALLLWARGLAFPLVAPGEEVEVPLLTALEEARIRHRPLRWTHATLARAVSTTRREVPAGSFEVRRASVRIAEDSGVERAWTFWVEEAHPRRLVAWESSSGERAELLGSERLAYWQLHDNGDEELLTRLGLVPRPPRTP